MRIELNIKLVMQDNELDGVADEGNSREAM
jgi:hypothetical protein